MAATELDLHVETETEKVERWRAEALERAGYDPSSARELADAARHRPPPRDRAGRSAAALALETRCPRSSRLRAHATSRRGAARRRIVHNPCRWRRCSDSSPRLRAGSSTSGRSTIHLYGLTLLVAILLCVWLTTVRWRGPGGDTDLVIRVAVWGVAFGVIGARAYHDITSWNEVPTPKWQGIFEIWEGGLGDLGRDPARRRSPA